MPPFPVYGIMPKRNSMCQRKRGRFRFTAASDLISWLILPAWTTIVTRVGASATGRTKTVPEKPKAPGRRSTPGRRTAPAARCSGGARRTSARERDGAGRTRPLCRRTRTRRCWSRAPRTPWRPRWNRTRTERRWPPGRPRTPRSHTRRRASTAVPTP